MTRSSHDIFFSAFNSSASQSSARWYPRFCFVSSISTGVVGSRLWPSRLFLFNCRVVVFAVVLVVELVVVGGVVVLVMATFSEASANVSEGCFRCSPSTICSKATGSEAVCDRRLKYAESFSPSNWWRKEGLLLLDADDEDVDDGRFDGYIFMMLCEAVPALLAICWKKFFLDGSFGSDGSFDAYNFMTEAVDTDWIPDSRDRDDNGKNASTLTLLAVRATKRSSSDDDEGEEKDFMLMLMMMMEAREGNGDRGDD
jgi:hypothetical protein